MAREVELGQKHVVGASLAQDREGAGKDPIERVDGPAVERVLGLREVREGLDEPGLEHVVERRERHAGVLPVVGEEAAFATRFRDGGDAQPAWPAPPAEHLEGLEQLVEVAHLDDAVMPKQRGEGARRADHRAGVGERGPRGGLRAPHLEADDGLARLGRARKRGGERARSPDGLDEQADRARALVLGEVRDEVRNVARELAAGRHDGAKAHARPAGEERLADRSGMRHAGHVSGHEGVAPGHGAEPERDTPRRRDAHAVGPHHRHVALGRPDADACRDGPALGPGLCAQPR